MMYDNAMQTKSRINHQYELTQCNTDVCMYVWKSMIIHQKAVSQSVSQTVRQTPKGSQSVRQAGRRKSSTTSIEFDT